MKTQTETLMSCKKRSQGEQLIAEYLEANSIEFVEEWSTKPFVNPKTNWPLRFDFFIASYNLAIEFDGKQHFLPSGREGAAETFKATRQRDRVKTKFCREREIRLLRISYKQINSINAILKRTFKKHAVVTPNTCQ